MYVANHFRLPDDRIEALLKSVRPGNFVTVHDDGPVATFAPFHLEERASGRVLVTHLVRNNPQVREKPIGPAMAILDITDAYVSPLWYATNSDLPNVPTWDYVTIHVWGRPSFDFEPVGALEAARQLTLRMEGPEVLEMVGDQKLQRMARAIVGVEIAIEKIEGKAKMSQNRHPDDVRSLIARFDEYGPREVADYLREVSLPYAEARFGEIERIGAEHRLPTFGAGTRS